MVKFFKIWAHFLGAHTDSGMKMSGYGTGVYGGGIVFEKNVI